jgi:hypothetical protein
MQVARNILCASFRLSALPLPRPLLIGMSGCTNAMSRSCRRSLARSRTYPADTPLAVVSAPDGPQRVVVYQQLDAEFFA